jgi:hypothetical protein
VLASQNDVICIPTTIPIEYFSHVVDVHKNRDRLTGERPEDYLVWFIKGTKDSYTSGKRSQPYDRQASSSSSGKTWKPKLSPLPEECETTIRKSGSLRWVRKNLSRMVV